MIALLSQDGRIRPKPMISTVQKLTKLSAVYVIGDLAVKGSAFLLLPLYANYLTPEDYGILAVATMVISVMTILISFGLTSAILRFYNQIEDPLERRHFFGTLWLFLVVAGGTITLLITLVGEPFFQTLFIQVPFNPYIRISLWVVFFNVAFATIPPALFRAEDNAKRYVAYNLVSFSVVVLLTIWLVVFQDKGTLGSITARLGSAILMAILSSIYLLRKVDFNLHFPYLKKALIYSLPFVPHLLAQWVLSVSDRIILERYVSLSELGIYSVGYQMGAAYLLLIAAINYPFLSLYSRAATNSVEYNQIPRLTTYYIFAALYIGLGFLLLIEDFAILLLPPKYYLSGEIANLLIWGYLSMSLYYPSTGTMIMTAGNTRTVPFVTGIVAFINIVLNLWFVPSYGVSAAIFSTIISYIILAILMYIVSQRVRHISYDVTRLIKLLLIFGIVILLSFLLQNFAAIINIFIGLLLLVLFPFGLILVNFWDAQEQEYIFLIKHKLSLKFKALKL